MGDSSAMAARRPIAAEQLDFDELFAEQHRPIYRYLRAWGLSDDHAADLTAEAFARAYRQRATYRPSDGAPQTWLFRIARNLAIDSARRQESAKRGLRFWPRNEVAPDPADLFLREEAERLLAQRVSALPATQREAIVLRFAAGLSAREIGAVLGRSEAAAHKLVSRALKALKEVYRGDE